MKLTLDSNIFVYANDNSDPTKQVVAATIIERAALGELVVTTQVLGEFLAVVRRKHPAILPRVVVQAQRMAALFPPVSTTFDDLISATHMAERYKLQFWDAVIWQVAASCGAQWFVSEDLQDGFTLNGMTAINPFESSNADRLEALLGA